MALPNANVLGNAATTTAEFQTAIEDLRQHVDDNQLLQDMSGQATAGQVPNLENLNGQATAGQVPNIGDLNGVLPVSDLEHIAAPLLHIRAGLHYLFNGNTGSMNSYSIDSLTAGVMHDIGTSEWGELSRVSLTAKAVILHVKFRTPNSGGTVSAFLCAADPSVSITPVEDNAIAAVTGDGSGYGHFCHQVIVPCSSRAIQLGWFKYGATNADIDIKYGGYIEA